MWPFRRGKPHEEKRSITSVPWGADGAPSGVVDQHRALSLVPVFSATSLIAADVSTLPICAYRKIGNVSQPMATLPQLFDILVSEGRIVQWLHRLATSLLLRGNAYGLILSRDGFGFPISIEWLDPTDVTVLDSAPSGPGSFMMPLYYWRGRHIPNEDMVHIPWYATPGRVQGLSPIAAFAKTIGVGLHVVDYGASWFEGGGFPPGTFQNTEQEVSQDVAEAVGRRLDVARRRRRPLVFGKDWTYNPISVPPNEAQFVESAQLNATMIASIYHVPPEWIGGSAGAGTLHYTSEEQYQIHYVSHGVRPWVETLEAAFFGLLPEKQFIKFDTDALVRADLKTRHEVYQIDASIGLRTINEMRGVENWAPLPEPQQAPTPPAPPQPDGAQAPTAGDPPPPAPASQDPPMRALTGIAGLADLLGRRGEWVDLN